LAILINYPVLMLVLTERNIYFSNRGSCLTTLVSLRQRSQCTFISP
jgi:hypothetical protein